MEITGCRPLIGVWHSSAITENTKIRIPDGM